jgi:NAD(P)-dependent dehydrogenase (short-subunit alcohol dehydrogenase family)
MHTLASESALVTGAGRGFGKAIALALANAGVAVTLTARSRSEIASVRDLILQRGGRAHAVAGDVCDPQDVRRVYDSHRAMFGPAAILVNCAGTAEPVGPIGQSDVMRWWRTMSVNVLGPLNYMSAVIPDMKAAGRGCIINVASVAAKFIASFNSAYCVSKATLVRLSEHVAQENAATGIVVFPVHPGVVYTALSDECVQSEEAKRWIPEFVTLLEQVRNTPNQEDGLVRCGERCVALVSGQHDHLSGKFLELDKADLGA